MIKINTRRTNCCRIILVLFLLFSTAVITRAQNNSGGLSGVVKTQENHPIEKANISLLNTTFNALTDASGKFTFTAVTPGRYTLLVTAAGYAATISTVDIANDKTASITLQMALAATQLDEVTVTAQKKLEPLQKIPVSISVFSAEQVRQYRLQNIKDISSVVPNLYSSNPGDGRNVTAIRGITTTSYDPAVTTYIDGVNQFGLDTYIGQLLDVDRIEVLKGPQGTLYGRNAMGGVINIITKQPGNNFNGFAEASEGNYGQQRYSAAVRFPIVHDKLFFGASLLYDGRNGFYTNTYNNKSYEKQFSLTGNYYLKYIASKKLSFTLNAKHANNRNDGAFPLVLGAADALEHPFELSQNATARMIDNVFNTSLSANYSGSTVNFSSQTAYQSNYRYYNAPLDGDFSAADAITINNNYGRKWNNVKVLTQEFRLTSPANSGSALQWTAGSYLFYQHNPAKQGTHYGSDAALLGAPDSNFSTINTSKANSYGIAFYGQASYSITRKLNIIAGLRYDYEKKKYAVKGEYQKDPSSNPVYTTTPDTSAAVNFSALSPKLGLSYQISNNNLAFLTYSRGYRTGGLTQLGSDPSQPPLYPFKPEYSNNIEAGIKNNFWNHKLRVNLTVFITTVTDAQVPTLVLPDAITITKNAGKLNSKGVELEVSSTPFKNWQVDYNAGYTDAHYTTLKVSGNGSVIDLAGNKQLFTPSMTSALALQYSWPLMKDDKLKLVLRGEWFYTGKEYFDLANTISQGANNLLNTHAGVRFQKTELMFWMRNIANRKYISYAYDFGAVHLGDPMTFGFTLHQRF